MNRSQLRRLARDYATGRLEYDEYVRERGELIDGMVCGDIAIESSADSTADFTATGSLDQRIKGAPLALIIGVCVVIAIIWAFLAPSETPPPGQGSQTTDEQPPGQRVSAARVLVEEFLTTRDWSGESLANFRDNWNGLTSNEQAEARTAPWFRRLAEALREEINAHKALAEFDGSGLSTTTGKRLAAFSEFLGIDAEMPEASVPQQRPPSTPTAEVSPLSASQWLAARSDDDYTLQLFAVNHLDRLERLIASHPGVPLYLLTFEGREPRYRMIHGAFSDEEQARAAHESLPAELRGESPQPFVRRIGELRREQREAPTTAAQPATDTPPVYTLQLFASTNKDNVDRLVARYQSLDLRVHTSDGETTRYRVLFGEFDSPEAAQEASVKLPAPMLEEVGTPLLRETTEFE
jgi:cell division septation protein DedD